MNDKIINIINYLKEFDDEKIYNLEKNKDLQFISLKNLREKIKDEKNINEYLYLIIQNSLISYQLSGNGESRWNEFSNQAEGYFNNPIENNLRREKILMNCKNNCRLNKTKLNRINKINDNKKHFNNLIKYGSNQSQLLDLISSTMQQSKTSKTIVFSIKMYIYGLKIILNKNIPYDIGIGIPVDSRLEKIYKYLNDGNNGTNKEIYDFFIQLGKNVHICPLGLDSILWIDYWHKNKSIINL